MNIYTIFNGEFVKDCLGSIYILCICNSYFLWSDKIQNAQIIGLRFDFPGISHITQDILWMGWAYTANVYNA